MIAPHHRPVPRSLFPRRLFAPLALVAASLAGAALVAAAPVVAQPPLAPTAAATSAGAPAALGDETRAEMTCAAAFAIAASEQRRGVQSALALPPLQVRGKEYFARVGAKAMDEGRLSRDAVRSLFEEEVTKLQQEAAGKSPDAALAAVMPACLVRLDSAVVPLTKPDLAQCAAIMGLAYQEVYAREGLSARARDLKTLAAVLESREREALKAGGLAGQAIDRKVSEQHEAMVAVAAADGPGVERYDLQVCYELARPEKGKHY